ncbi:MAG: Holliday junction resolvase RuvX [Candidatus Kaiserbacteria bacterium]|nr:Holliday junction resolvase RuvX [Candidatus Kaiserbacteria bacterium]
MILLGLDYGARRIGVAVAPEGIAFPRKILSNTNLVMGEILNIIKDEQITHIIMGDTRAGNGLKNTISTEAELFADQLRERAKLPVELVWEVGSTVEAGRYATDENQHNDAAAAAIILQRYIDMHRRGGASEDSTHDMDISDSDVH